MMKKWSSIILLLLMSMLTLTSLQAKTVTKCWIELPDSIVRLLNVKQRKEMVEQAIMTEHPMVTNLMGGTCRLDTLSEDYMKVSLSASSMIELKLLKRGDDTLLLVLSTYLGPEKETELLLLDEQRQRVKMKFPKVEDLLLRPDTMKLERFAELKKLLEPKMVNITLLPHIETLVFRLSLPLLWREDRSAVSAILLQRKLKWNGEQFNEY